MPNDDSPGDQLQAQLLTINAQLDDVAHSHAYLQALASAVQSAQLIDPDRPALWLPLTSALLAWASTATPIPQLATALANASRAYAAIWGQEQQLAAFRAQLDGYGAP